jgi:hypothetical protein
MDLRLYFQKLAETEQIIESPNVFVTSLPTPDGGREGVVSEVSRTVAAQLFVEGRARKATDAEQAEYRGRIERAVAKAEQERLASKVQVTVVSDPELRSRNLPRPHRG